MKAEIKLYHFFLRLVSFVASMKAKIKAENANPSFGSYKLFYYCKQGIKFVLTRWVSLLFNLCHE